MAGHAQLNFVMTECSKIQIRLTGLICLGSKLLIQQSMALLNWSLSDNGAASGISSIVVAFVFFQFVRNTPSVS